MINIIQHKFIAGIAIMSGLLVAASVSGQTIPAGTMVSIQTTSSISSTDPAGRTFKGRVDQDVVANGQTLLKAGTNVTGSIQTSRTSSRPQGRSEPLSLGLTSISINGRDIAIKTANLEPQAPSTIRETRSRAVTAGTHNIPPGTKLQFQLAEAVTL